MEQIIKLQKAIKLAKEQKWEATAIESLVKALNTAIQVFKSTQIPMAKQRLFDAMTTDKTDVEKSRMIKDEILRKFPDAKDVL